MNGFERFSQYSAVKTDRNPEKMYTREFIGIECPAQPGSQSPDGERIWSSSHMWDVIKYLLLLFKCLYLLSLNPIQLQVR